MKTLRKWLGLLAIVLIFFVISGCAGALKTQSTVCITSKVFSEEENEKLGKNFEEGQELIQKFRLRKEQIKIGKTTYADLKTMELDPEAVNVSHYPGQTNTANKYRFGSENPQLQFRSSAEIENFTREQAKWYVLEYPLYNIKELSDRFYFSKKDKEKIGTDIEFVVILKDTSNSPNYIDPKKEPRKYIVQYAYEKGQLKMQRKETETATGGGIVEILNETRDQLQIIIFFYFLQDSFKK